MSNLPDGKSPSLLEPTVDIGNWMELQARIEEHFATELERLTKETMKGLEALEERFHSYVTPNSFKRSIHR